jgi:hypothetical protein
VEVHHPKPWHGWREFAKEIGTIVIGVLIALAAEQTVEALHRRHAIEEARGALDKELAWNRMAFDIQTAQATCASRRLDDLERWASASPAGPRPALARPIGRPLGVSYRTSIWRAVSNIVADMPLQQRLAYAEIYDDLENAERIREAERAAWADLGQFREGGVFTPERRGRFEADIEAARAAITSISADRAFYSAPFARLGIKASPPPHNGLIVTTQRSFCSALLVG